MSIPNNYLEKLYAGWLGKIIGVRHGANIEGWTYERIQKTFGEIDYYPFDFKNFAADDDLNGPAFFMRVLDDYTYTSDLTPEMMGLNLLNYVPDEHGFFWWGGYGKSTEHTAYTNLKNGIMAPRSGSIDQNGPIVAEQIGGQIFSDVWGFVTPGNPQLAAEYAGKMSSVTHDGEGLYGGMFIAACVSAAFVEDDIEKVIEVALSNIPRDSTYHKVVTDIINFYKNEPSNWRDCFKFIYENYGYDKFDGACHIIPNAAVIVLSLLYGKGDFSKTINICNMCGWDTDCNVGNAGAIAGVLYGLEGIGRKWIEPINDFVCFSSVIGSLNIWDIPSLVCYTARFGYLIAGEQMPIQWKEYLTSKNKIFHFEFPGSTHAFRAEADKKTKIILKNTKEKANTGNRSLKACVPFWEPGNRIRVFYKTYYTPEDFNDSRYDPDFSPILYPGQTIKMSVALDKESVQDVTAAIFISDRNSKNIIRSNIVELRKDRWIELEFKIPHLNNFIIEKAGIEFNTKKFKGELIVYIDDVKFEGEPDYSIDFSTQKMEVWNPLHQTPSQLTYRRGIWVLEDGQLSGSFSGDSAECYTGNIYWDDYEFEAVVKPMLGEYHNISFRVQGCIKSYAAGLAPNGKVALYKNKNGYIELTHARFDWQCGKEYFIKARVYKNKIEIFVNGTKLIDYIDIEAPYLRGAVGFSNLAGSHTHYKSFKVKGL